MSENDETNSGGMSGPDAGLSKTGRTADDFEPGDRTASDYSAPGGLDREEDEEA
jgi:hypothetical protein